jgi:predicted nucleic-acid-binding protein
MIGLDTNILLRHLAQDDPVQSPLATKIIEQRFTEADPGFVSVVVVVEIAWVLKRGYRLPDREIAKVIEHLLETDTLVIERERHVYTAMVALRERRGSFADALIGELATEVGCSTTLTFDRKALRLAGFELP